MPGRYCEQQNKNSKPPNTSQHGPNHPTLCQKCWERRRENLGRKELNPTTNGDKLGWSKWPGKTTTNAHPLNNRQLDLNPPARGKQQNPAPLPGGETGGKGGRGKQLTHGLVVRGKRRTGHKLHDNRSMDEHERRDP